MRYRLISSSLLILFSFSVLPAAHAEQVVYLIRHAEQMLDVEDPPITEIGQERAKTWARVLRDAELKVIYTSKKRRTMETGEIIARELKVPTAVMSRKDVSGLVDRIRAENSDDAVLIVSHSKTIPKLIKAFGSWENGSIKREDYDNLFVIVPKGEDDVATMRLRYQ